MKTMVVCVSIGEAISLKRMTQSKLEAQPKSQRGVAQTKGLQSEGVQRVREAQHEWKVPNDCEEIEK